jgi:hypothetical protein
VDGLTNFSSLLCAALPTRFCCNESSCGCFDKTSELHLALGKGSKCSACSTARYCGAADQHKHWKQHKHVCKAVATAATAATAAQEPAAYNLGQRLSKGKKKGNKQQKGKDMS